MQSSALPTKLPSPISGDAAGRSVALVTAPPQSIDPANPPPVGRRGVDYSWAKLGSAKALRAAGYSFVIRYLSTDDSKNLHAPEVENLVANGLQIVANWESSLNSAASATADRGFSDAQQAMGQAAACGKPDDRPIYFSVDYDARNQLEVIGAYFDGVAKAMGGVARVGVYGGYYVVKWLLDQGKVQWGWQTIAWSDGQWDDRARIRQTDVSTDGNTLSLPPPISLSPYDADESTKADFGQWPSTVLQPPADPPEPPAVGDPVAFIGAAPPGGQDGIGQVAQVISADWNGPPEGGDGSGAQQPDAAEVFHLDKVVDHGVRGGQDQLILAVAHPSCLHSGGEPVVTGSRSVFVGVDRAPLAGQGDRTNDGGVIHDRSDESIYMT